jgi:hypothetical protein
LEGDRRNDSVFGSLIVKVVWGEDKSYQGVEKKNAIKTTQNMYIERARRK